MAYLKELPKIGDLFYIKVGDIGVLDILGLNKDKIISPTIPILSLSDLDSVKESLGIDSTFISDNFSKYKSDITILKYKGKGEFIELYSGFKIILISSEDYIEKNARVYSLNSKRNKITDSISLMSLISEIYENPLCVKKVTPFDLSKDNEILGKLGNQDARIENVLHQVRHKVRTNIKFQLKNLAKNDEPFAYAECKIREQFKIKDKPKMLEKTTSKDKK